MATEGAYFFLSNDQRSELDRLQLQERTIDWISIGVLTRLGIGPGARCLDAGFGAGSMLRWMAGVCGSGHAVGIDLDDRFFEVSASADVELRKEDLLTTPLEEAHYDFIHCRLVLMHLSDADRELLLQRFHRALRPGGWLVVLDAAYGFEPVRSEERAQQLWNKVSAAVLDAFLPRVDFGLGARLVHLLDGEGFEGVEGAGVFGLPAAGGDHRQMTVVAARTAKRLAVVDGRISDEELDELIVRAEAGEVQAAVPYGVAWGRRPGDAVRGHDGARTVPDA